MVCLISTLLFPAQVCPPNAWYAHNAAVAVVNLLQGYGVYKFADKYGANVDGYSPIYTPDLWTEGGDSYKLGTKGLIAWCVFPCCCVLFCYVFAAVYSSICGVYVPVICVGACCAACESYKLGTKGLIACCTLLPVMLFACA
jgi:hypothetical protein